MTPKRLLLLLGSVLLLHNTCFAQPLEKNESVDTLLHTLYKVISGPPGVRNWDVFRSLFHPNATMGIIRSDSSGQQHLRTFTPEEYIEKNGPIMEKTGFHETETGREILQMKDMILVKSTYEWTSGSRSDKGVNAIVLVRVAHRWCIYSLFWQSL